MKLKMNSKGAEFAFYLGYMIYSIGMVLSSSMISHSLGLEFLMPLCKAVSLTLLLGSWGLRATHSLKHIFVTMLFLGTLAIVFLRMGSYDPFLRFFVILSAYKMSPKKIAKCFLATVGMMVLASALLAQAGIIENRLFYNEGGLRQSMGMIYPNTFSALSFNIFAMYIFIRKDNIKMFDKCFVLGGTLVTYYFARTRLELIASLLLLLLVLLYPHIKNHRFFTWLFVYSYVIFCAVTFILAFLYVKFPDQMQIFDKIMSGRLSLEAIGIQDYGFSLFGKFIPMQGYATLNFDWAKGYFYIDAFYMNYALQYGLLLLVMFLCLVTWQLKYISKYDHWILIFAFLSAIHGVIIANICTPNASPIVMMIVAQYTSLKDTPFQRYIALLSKKYNLCINKNGGIQ